MCSTSGDTSDENVRPSRKISSIGIVLKYSVQLQFDIRYWKVIPNYARKHIFLVMTSSMTSQEDLEIVPLYSRINEKWPFFRNNRDIIITPSVCMYHWILNMRIYLVMDYITDDVIRATNKSKLWTAIALSYIWAREAIKSSKCMKLNWISENRFSFTYRSANLASTQSPIALSFVCLCLYHDVCLDDLTMKDWCHTNNFLLVHCWGCLVVQVMFHAFMTSSMTSPGHKVGQILKLAYVRQYSNWSSIKSSKCRKCSWLSFWYIIPV